LQWYELKYVDKWEEQRAEREECLSWVRRVAQNLAHCTCVSCKYYRKADELKLQNKLNELHTRSELNAYWEEYEDYLYWAHEDPLNWVFDDPWWPDETWMYDD
jgi:hypothetical protein